MNKSSLLAAVLIAAFPYDGLSAQQLSPEEAGEMLYDEHCSTCHGEKLRSSGAIPDLRQLAAGDRPRFDTIVAEGKDQMPSWEGVIDAKGMDQLWAYIRSRAR
jgi:mono/diheme cytochrome c family protein